MEANGLKVEIDCDDQVVQELRKALMPNAQPRFIERRNLSGDTAAWIVIATLTVQALPHLLEFIVKWLELSRVKRIKVGDFEIENPSREDVENLKKRFGATKE